MEADPRHAELVCEQLLKEGSRRVTTPGTEVNPSKEDEEELTGEEVKRFRSTAARCNYLGQDRPDLQYAVKEVCREMSKPTQGSQRRLLRLAQYLQSQPKLIWRYDWQGPVSVLDSYGDADWVACQRTRKSTSGGCIRRGMHCLRTWSKTQALVAKSSAESELYALVRASCEGPRR